MPLTLLHACSFVSHGSSPRFQQPPSKCVYRFSSPIAVARRVRPPLKLPTETRLIPMHRDVPQNQIVSNIKIAATPIITVADQPTTLTTREFTCLPMTRSLLATNMMTTISGGAIKPLITAE